MCQRRSESKNTTSSLEGGFDRLPLAAPYPASTDHSIYNTRPILDYRSKMTLGLGLLFLEGRHVHVSLHVPALKHASWAGPAGAPLRASTEACLMGWPSVQP